MQGVLKYPNNSVSYRKTSGTVTRRCSVKKVSLTISQNSQGNTCARVSFLIKLRVKTCFFIKKRLCRKCLSVNFQKFLRTSFFIKHLCGCFSKSSSKVSLTILKKSCRIIVLENSIEKLIQTELL